MVKRIDSVKMNKKNIEEVLKKYNEINNSFKKRLVFHVGDGAGFYSEVNAMMQCILWCYTRKIKFELYADDANFAGGHGWSEFFEPFCSENHNRLNHYGNHRFNKGIRDYRNYIQFSFSQFILRHLYNIDYLTQDIFAEAIDRKVSQVEIVDCDVFDVHGVSFEEFAKLIEYVMRYNKETLMQIEKKIEGLNLPDNYSSVQIRGGDKTLEYEKLNDVDLIISRILENDPTLKNLFIFTDDYRYVAYVKTNYSNINIYTLTREDEAGYINATFQKAKWPDKREDMIKLFAMVELCLKSDVHYGNEYTCVNQYIEFSRKLDNKKYKSVWMREESGIIL